MHTYNLLKCSCRINQSFHGMTLASVTLRVRELKPLSWLWGYLWKIQLSGFCWWYTQSHLVWLWNNSLYFIFIDYTPVCNVQHQPLQTYNIIHDVHMIVLCMKYIFFTVLISSILFKLLFIWSIMHPPLKGGALTYSKEFHFSVFPWFRGSTAWRYITYLWRPVVPYLSTVNNWTVNAWFSSPIIAPVIGRP